MKDNTPHRLRPATERPVKQACLRALFERAPEVSAIWEAFGGIGVQAEVLRERWPQAFICATELDAECVEEYNRNGWGECTLSDCCDQ